MRQAVVTRGLVGRSVSAMVLALCGTACGAGAAPVSVAMLEITGTPADAPSALAWLTGGAEPTLRDYVDAIYAAADDDELGAMVIRVKDADLNAAQIEELGSAIRWTREAGKKIHVFAEAMGPAEFMLGSYADHVMVQAGGPVSLPGLYMEEMYLADTLAWAGLHADMIQVGDYKGANEQMTRSAPSPAWDQNISGLLDAMYGELRRKLTEGRGLTEAQLDAAMNELWMGSASDAVRVGLADAEVDLADMLEHLGTVHGEVAYAGEIPVGPEGMELDMANPFAMLAMLTQEPQTDATEPTIAVLHLNGPIVDGDSTAAGLMGGASVGSRTLRNAMLDIEKDDEIKGVVVRIDSPGGSATASEMILIGLRRLAEIKPVWVSVGSMAASGGYYAAVGGDRIYVNPSSIVGSIGVVGGKISFGDLLGKGKVRVVERARGPRADMLGGTTQWDDAQRELVREKMTETYDLFTRRVSEGRDGIDISKVAEGRLFVGQAAVDMGMADQVGGLDLVIGDLATELGMDTFEIMDFPAPQSLDEVLQDTLGGFMGAKAGQAAAVAGVAAVLEGVLGAERFSAVRDQLSALSQLRDQRVLLTSPVAIRIGW